MRFCFIWIKVLMDCIFIRIKVPVPALDVGSYKGRQSRLSQKKAADMK